MGVNSNKSNLEKEKSRIQAKQARYKNAMDPLAAKMKANFDAWTQQKARFDQLKTKIAAAQVALGNRCRDATPAERGSAAIPQILRVIRILLSYSESQTA